MNDIKDLLDEAVGSYEPRLDQRAVEERFERRKQRRRFAAGSVAVAVFVLAGWFAWTAFRPGGATVGSTGSGTYVLSDFEVSAHIERDSIAPGPAEVDPSQADVSFTMRWSSNEYPGEHRCSFKVFDAAGSAIGSFSSPIASLLEDNSSSTPVPVTGSIEGATATGSCGPERLDTPIAYDISDVHLMDDLTVSYVVGWPDGLRDGEYPGTNACTVTLFESGHPIAEKHLTLAVGDQQEVTSTQFNKFNDSVLVPRASLDITVACEPYVRENVYPDPKPLTDATVTPEIETVIIPDLIGLSRDQAVAQLESLGLTVAITVTQSENALEGTIASQDPAPGTSADAGTTVTIVIGEGPTSPESDPYPRGAFEWCPGPPFPEGGRDRSAQASAAALRFVEAYAAGDDSAVTELLDSSVPSSADFPIELAKGAEPSVISTNPWGGSLVEFACGSDAAANTVAVTMDDGSGSASLDFMVYLVLRDDGWKVWALY